MLGIFCSNQRSSQYSFTVKPFAVDNTGSTLTDNVVWSPGTKGWREHSSARYSELTLSYAFCTTLRRNTL